MVDRSSTLAFPRALPKTRVAAEYAQRLHEGQRRQADGFGLHVSGLVCALTEDDGIKGYARRKAALRDQVAYAGNEALMVFAADKLSKARELSLGDGVGVTVRRRRMTHYRRCPVLLQERLPEFPLVALLRTELEMLTDRGIGERATAPCG